jgi:hypothetical protein
LIISGGGKNMFKIARTTGVPLVIGGMLLGIMVVIGLAVAHDPALARCQEQVEREYGSQADNYQALWYIRSLYQSEMRACKRQADLRRLSPQEREVRECVNREILHGATAQIARAQCATQ